MTLWQSLAPQARQASALQQRCQQIVTSPVLTPEQKRHFLALEAENALPYPTLPEDAR
ncbi:hypothetical protein MJN54_30065, partial [Salmonella enterica subsp. enterica serovar Kentucky]|nr:hypothetical protein [Salmonella enterica subsp. enterica serovar Kentucky]